MSRGSGICAVKSPLSAALLWFKKFASRYFWFAERIVRCKQRHRDNRIAVAPEASIMRPTLQIELCGGQIELKELTEVLRIGDRIRLFCNDGVLVAEKVSHTQLKVIQSQGLAELIH
jgi:hypothetical protein